MVVVVRSVRVPVDLCNQRWHIGGRDLGGGQVRYDFTRGQPPLPVRFFAAPKNWRDIKAAPKLGTGKGRVMLVRPEWLLALLSDPSDPNWAHLQDAIERDLENADDA